MNTSKKLLSIALLISMALSLLGGFPGANAAPRTVAAGEELAFDPFAQTASVAYERHTDGYAVSLDRAADSVTMRITAVPAASDRTADGARLYVLTGAALRAGVSYRVSFTLSAAQALPAYTVCLDGDAESAYGTLSRDGIEAGGTDRVSCLITPEASRGELTLRLLLGGGEVNTLRFGGLSVEEAADAETGENRVLVDRLDYNAPGTIRFWTNDDCGATVTNDDRSATLTVTRVPQSGAEVWKIKLLVATGVMPEAGKTYRFRASLNSTAQQSYEICYNEGDTEKGYDVLYNQTLRSGTQTLDRRIYVPTYKENPGELIVQLSLGKLKVGDRVTISDISVEESVPTYTNALAKDFALDRTETVTTYDPANLIVTGSTPAKTSIDFNDGVLITSGGDRAGDLKLDAEAGTATLEIAANDDAEDGVWEARLGIDTGVKLLKKPYLVQFELTSDVAYDNYEVFYGTSADDKAYGGYWGCKLSDDDKGGTTVSNIITPDAASDKPLVITLQMGQTGGADNTLVVSDLSIAEPSRGKDISAERYTGTPGTVSVRSGDFAEVTGDDDDSSATVTFKEGKLTGDSWQRELLFLHVCDLEPSATYVVGFDIAAADALDGGTWYKVHFNKGAGDDDGAWTGENIYGDSGDGATATAASSHFSQNITTTDNGGRLNLVVEIGDVGADTAVTVSNVSVTKSGESDNLADVRYADHSSSFRVGESNEGALYNGQVEADDGGAKLTCWGPTETGEGDAWRRRLFIDKVADLSANSVYEISYQIKANKETVYESCCNLDDHFANGGDGVYGKNTLTVSGDETYQTVTQTVFTRSKGGQLHLMLNVGRAVHDTFIWVKDIQVKKVSPSGATLTGKLGGSFWTEMYAPYDGTLTKDSANKTATFAITSAAAQGSDQWQGYNAKLLIRTGVTYQPGKNYRASFKLHAEEAVNEFCVITKGVSDSEDIRGTWGLSIGADETKTITTRPIPAGKGSGELNLQIELGKLTTDTNAFTVSDIKVEEVSVRPSVYDSKVIGSVYCDSQEGYRVQLERGKDAATAEIVTTPAAGLEAWKVKLFLDPQVRAQKGEAYRVVMDVTPEQDMNYEVCYNRDGEEKGFDAVFGLHAKAGEANTLEKVFVAEQSGALIVQLSLGTVPAPNRITVRNVRVERVTYAASGVDLLSGPVSYRAPGAVSYWAHADYTTSFTGSDDAVTAHIIQPAVKGPEPWKIKLFLDTGAVLEPGRHYKVSATLSAKQAQDFEICYNNGGVEMGYDSFGGLRLAAGQPQTFEKLISVPAGKTDAHNLMLQFNLGKTSVPNDVTVSGVTVEEISLAYADSLSKAFSYQTSLSTWLNPDYAASLETAEDSATFHITAVPANDPAVWKAKLLIRTGAILQAGRSYLVRADLLAAKAQDYEVCFNNEETEKGFDALYGQKIEAATPTTVERKISVPASMTDAGELVLQLSLGGAVTNDVTVSNVSVQELRFGGSDGAGAAPDTVVSKTAGTLDVSRQALTFRAADGESTVTVAGAKLRAMDRYAVAFTARASKDVTGTLTLAQPGKAAALTKSFALTPAAQTCIFTTDAPLTSAGLYDLRWAFDAAADAEIVISDVKVYVPAETLQIIHNATKVTVNGTPVTPDSYNINGYNYYKLRDLATLLNGTMGQFVVRYNPDTKTAAITTGKAYTPIGGELTASPDRSALCQRIRQPLTVNGESVDLKAYSFGGYNFFRLRDLNPLLGFDVDYIAATDTAAITSPLTPERMEAGYDYGIFFRPEIDGESQPYVGDTMPYYEDGTYYIYYLKDGGDAYNHSVYLTTTKDFVTYTERQTPVLEASRDDVQDNWIGTGSLVKAENEYYFFYTGFNASGSHEYREKLMVAKGSSPTSFTKVAGWEITPPAELHQKTDFRDPQAYYDPATGTFSLTVTASQDGAARILKYTLSRDLQDVRYDGVIYTDPTGAFWNLECSDTFRLGDKWYLTYSGQDDTLWYAMSDSRFGPYTNATRLDGKLFYAAKHIEDGKNTYMVGWARRGESASSTQEVNGWAGNVAVQRLIQNPDGSLALVGVESILNAFGKPQTLALDTDAAIVTSGGDYVYRQAFTAGESFKLSGSFTYTGSGAFGLAFDYSGKPEQYKLISLDPAKNTLSLRFNEGETLITETKAALAPNTTHTFTYIQDGSIGMFYLDGQASLTVRLYGATGKPVFLFAENNSVSFTNLRLFAR